MGKMKLEFEKVAEIFRKLHPEFSDEDAKAYVLFHHNNEYWRSYEKRVLDPERPKKRIITVEESSEEKAEELAVRIGLRVHYNFDYLESRIIIQQVGTKVIVTIFEECVLPIPNILILGEHGGFDV